MWRQSQVDQLVRLLLIGLGFAGGAIADWGTAAADVLYLKSEPAPVSGRLIEETDTSVVFQIRLGDGSEMTRTFALVDVSRVIRTINPETLATAGNGTNTEVFAFAETLLAIHHDLEAQHCGQELLTELLQRDSLTDEWKQAICRLQLQAQPPGLPRERLRRQWRESGLYTESPITEQDPPDPWQWFVVRLSAETKTEWLRAIRSDRASIVADPASEVLVPRAEIQRCIRQTRAMMVEGDPTQRWTTELLATLASDDLSALVTLARLESILCESRRR